MAFWSHLINSGCAGHTYGVNGVWQVNGKTKPYGNSPAGNNWGTTPWDVAMNLPGSAQVGAAATLIESLPHWNDLEPHPEWVSSANAAEAPAGFTGAQWIWFPEGEPAKDAPVAARYFQTEFSLPKEKRVKQASLSVSADDHCEVWLNGTKLGERSDWMRPMEISGLAGKLKSGGNVLAILAENRDPSAHPNPAGLIAHLEIVLDDNSRVQVVTDGTWRCGQKPHSGWPAHVAEDQAGWVPAKLLGSYGTAPWGKVPSQQVSPAPLCAGVADTLRLVYFQTPGSAKIKALPVTGVFGAEWFDPVSGHRSPSVTGRPDAAGEITATTPDGAHDWLFVLRRIP
jgi:hypothetical protein